MRLTTLCYIEKDGKYLMLHRTKKKNDENHDKWIGVGGKFEPGESPDECLIREVKEETGLTLTTYQFRGIVTFCSDEWEDEYMHLFTATEFERRSQSDCVHEQVAKADCECPFYWVKLAEMKRVLFYAEELFEKIQKQSVNKMEDSLDKVDGDGFSKAKNKDNRTVQDFREITFFSVADGAYDSGELVREYLRPYGFEAKVQLVPNIEEAVARTYSGMGAMIIDEWSRERKNTSLQHIVLDSCNEAVLAWRNENKNPAFSCFLQEIQKLL